MERTKATTTVRAALKARMKKPDTNVNVPKRQQEASLTSQLCLLEIGGCAFKGGYVANDTDMLVYLTGLADIKERLRNSVASCVLSASNMTGHTFSTSTLVAPNAVGRILVQVIIERVA